MLLIKQKCFNYLNLNNDLLSFNHLIIYRYIVSYLIKTKHGTDKLVE